MGLVDQLGRMPGPPPSAAPEPAQWVVVTDASFRDGYAVVAGVAFADGWAMREPLELFCEVMPARDPAQAERFALRRAIEQSRVLGWGRVQFYTDAADAVKVVAGLPAGYEVAWAPRQRVGAAHRLARRKLRRWRACR